jgi:hypothetical protein
VIINVPLSHQFNGLMLLVIAKVVLVASKISEQLH